MTTFSDTLDGTPGDLLRNRSGWSRPTGADEAVVPAGGSGFALTGGTTAASGTWHAPTSQPSGNDQFCEIRLFAGGDNFGCGTRCDITNALGQAMLARANASNNIQMFRRTSIGGLVSLGTFSSTSTNVGAGHFLRLESVGDQHTVWFMGAIVIGPVTDATIASGSVAALSRGGTTSTVRVDDWSSGDIAAAITIPIGTAEEIDTALAQPLAIGVGSAAETDAAFATPLGVTIGIATETDTAVAQSLAIGVGAATETDTAYSLPASITIGTAEETDTALALGLGSVTPVGTAEETDTAFGLPIAITIGTATEADTALALLLAGDTTIGTAEETDSALALPLAVGIGTAAETDTAPGLSVGAGIGAAEETDGALPLALSIGIGLATETDTAFGLPLVNEADNLHVGFPIELRQNRATGEVRQKFFQMEVMS